MNQKQPQKKSFKKKIQDDNALQKHGTAFNVVCFDFLTLQAVSIIW